MDFLNNFTIDLAKLPKYEEFHKIFTEPLDATCVRMCLESPEHTDIIKNTLKTHIYDKMCKKTGNHKVKYNQPCDMGRFYGNTNTITDHKRKIKHTIMKFCDWKDIDQSKGHPTIISEWCKLSGSGTVLTAIDEYIVDYKKQFTQMAEHYGLDIITNESDMKDLYNIMIYGGSHKTWVKSIEDPSQKELDNGRVAIKLKTTIPRPYEKRFKKDCDSFAKIIFENNPAIKERLLSLKKYENCGEYKLKSSMVSFALQIVENHALYVAYMFGVESGIIEPLRCSLEKDGLCFKPACMMDVTTFCNELNQKIYDEMGMAIKYTHKEYKPMNIDEDIINKRNDDGCDDILEQIIPDMGVTLLDTGFTESQLNVFYNKFDVLLASAEDKERLCLVTGSLADVFKYVYGDRFVYCNGQVFHFNGIYWKPDNKNKSRLSCFVDVEFYSVMVGYFRYRMKKLYAKINANNTVLATDTIGKQLDDMRMTITTSIGYFRSQKVRMLLVNNICDKICNDEQVWNKNPNMFCFDNCVFDVTTGKKVNGNPLDFINVSCGYDYDDNYSLKLVTELEALITSIQPDEAVKKYLLQVLSTSLLSEQIQAFFILTGKGGNGKSVLMELMVEMLGPYSYNLPAGFISKVIKDGGNPEASGMDGKRLIIVSEPESKDPICCATIKKVTGDTKINVRALWSNQTGIELKGTVIMICNEKPALDEVNDAVSRRMRAGVIPFTQKFVSKYELDNADEEEKKQFNMKLGDVKYVSQEFKTNYRQALFMILLPYLKHYQNTLFSDAPPIVLKESRAYIQGCDVVYEWFDDNYEEDQKEVVFVSDLYNNFKGRDEFYKMSKADKRKYQTISCFKETLQSNLFIRKFYKERKQYWCGTQYDKPFIAGWKLKVEEEETEEICGSDTTTVVNN